MNLLSQPFEKLRELDLNIDVNSMLKDRNLAYHFKAPENKFGSLATIDSVGTSKSLRSESNENLVIVPPKPKLPEILKYSAEQAYEGTVIEVNKSAGVFTARLIDLSNNGPDEEGEFSLNELNGDDTLVVPGALFSWVIGMQTRGTRYQRVSEIRFRRIPPFSKQSIDKAEESARELSQFFAENHSVEPFELRI